ncbi:ParB N-terminal domain-containing protein [Maritimibacter sp. HL-12]|uniref:ParB N-terminal domain-containing protein n=1 Tax=Maritimibacter sp. HL-12 TaxID=1162418 RepID=UPI000A0F2EAB|nr:ParB N-terminal domain-containing protein [Maritimibacter sp. HL-12]SMH36044.1 chromosome partitioning protein, ParB family [Maritimibacter sp. HL-12]
MREGKVIGTGTIRPDDIEVGKRLRPVSEAGVQSVLTSYEEIGVIKDPIDLRKMKEGAPRLIAGAHRLEAARRLGIEVPYKLWDCTADWALMCEIDDNLAGADLTPLDTAVFLAERKKVYEKVHPEARRGFAGGKARHGQLTVNMTVSSFAASSAEAMACSESTVYKLLRAGLALSSDEIRWLREAPKQPTGKDLEALSKIGDEHERKQVCIALTNGKAKNAAAARRALAAERGEKPAVKSPREQALQRLVEAWERAPLEVRRAFVAEQFDAVADLVSDEHERRDR